MSKLDKEGHIYNPRSKPKHEESPDCWCEPNEFTMTPKKKIYMHKNGKATNLRSVILHKDGRREVV